MSSLVSLVIDKVSNIKSGGIRVSAAILSGNSGVDFVFFVSVNFQHIFLVSIRVNVQKAYNNLTDALTVSTWQAPYPRP